MLNNNEVNTYKIDRELKRKQIKSTNDIQQKNNLRNQIKQSIIDEKEKELKDREEKLRKKKSEIVEEFYYLNKRYVNMYRVLGLVKSDRQINERFCKSKNYFKSSEYQQHMPKLDFIREIIDDIDNVIFNLEYLLDDNFNRAVVERNLKELQNRYKELKLKILTEIYI